MLETWPEEFGNARAPRDVKIQTRNASAVNFPFETAIEEQPIRYPHENHD
jgi:hypothetical protein